MNRNTYKLSLVPPIMTSASSLIQACDSYESGWLVFLSTTCLHIYPSNNLYNIGGLLVVMIHELNLIPFLVSVSKQQVQLGITSTPGRSEPFQPLYAGAFKSTPHSLTGLTTLVDSPVCTTCDLYISNPLLHTALPPSVLFCSTFCSVHST